MFSVKKILIGAGIAISLIATANPASAHTSVTSTSPSAGSTTPGGLIDIKVTFSDDVIQMPGTSKVIIKSSAGTSISPACVVIKKNTISTSAYFPSADTYQVIWRTVSQDGHSLTNHFEFEVSKPAAKVTKTLRCDNGTTTETDTLTVAKPDTTKLAQDVQNNDSRNTTYLYIGAGALAVVLIGVLLALPRRKASK